MKVVCCSCGLDLGDKPGCGAPEDAVSHGLCEPCGHHFRAQAGMPLSQYLEGIEAPVVTMSAEGTVGTANARALALLGKSPAQIEGFLGGDVFDCENARLPEGCGKTIHCSGCTIRNTVMETVRTGRPHQRVPAYLSQFLDPASRRVELLISTEKRGGVVFLTIDHIAAAVP